MSITDSENSGGENRAAVPALLTPKILGNNLEIRSPVGNAWRKISRHALPSTVEGGPPEGSVTRERSRGNKSKGPHISGHSASDR